ncbi:MAG: zinc dependent phospholipase C family protein [Spirochaetia bacterium]
MPAQISHTVFAKRAVTRVLGDAGKRLASEFLNYLALGAQGPDMFLHNQRTEPSGFLYGRVLHDRTGYGSFISSMAEYLLEGSSDGPHAKGSFVSPESAFLLGYATHAVLDRYTHPFINYFAGWVDPQREETKKYHQAHAFFERILDVFVLEEYENRDIYAYDFYSLVDCGPEIPARIKEQLVYAIGGTFGRDLDHTRDISGRVSSAYLDTMYFYELTNPPARDNMRAAYEMDKAAGFKFRYLALFHPANPREFDVDFLNEAHAPWQDPCKRTGESGNGPAEEAEIRRDSFFELFEAAEKAAAEVVEAAAEVLEGRRNPETLEGIIGNGNLNNGSLEPCVLSVSSPLPLPELIDKIYREFTPG